MENTLAGIFGVLLGLIGMLTALAQLRNLAALRSWRKVSGNVVERGTFRITHATRSTPAFQYSPLVRYSYRVGEREYSNDAIAPRHIQRPAHHTLQWAEEKAAAFPDELTVFYNPENPADSFLIPTPKMTLRLVLGISSLVGLASLIFLIGGRK